jgi:alanine racemase
MGVIKSNAYGHNLMEFSAELERLGIDRLGVDSLVEGLSVRRRDVRIPILVLGYTLPDLYDEARKERIAITISSFAQLKNAMKKGRVARPLSVHIKIDTGMHRQGFQLHELRKLLDELRKADKRLLSIEGVYTHFAEAKQPRSGQNTREQIAQFELWRKTFLEEGYTPIFHASATGGTLLYPSAHYDMVRIGIGLYGLWPSKESRDFLEKKIELRPVLSWRAVIGEVKEVKSGERVGYDFTERLTRNSRLAVVPVGYWHGLPRLLSSKGRVLIHGKTARIIGRVSMDMIVVDVTDIPKAAEGSVATLIGKDGNEDIKAGELADFAATTHYEIVTRLNPLMRKIYK